MNKAPAESGNLPRSYSDRAAAARRAGCTACTRIEELAKAAKRAGHPGTDRVAAGRHYIGLLDGRWTHHSREEIINDLLAHATPADRSTPDHTPRHRTPDDNAAADAAAADDPAPADGPPGPMTPATLPTPRRTSPALTFPVLTFQ